MKNNKLISLLLALLVCFSLVVTVSANDAGSQELTVAVEANPSTVKYGETITVSVMINENPGFLGANFALNWETEDSKILEVVSVDKTVSDYKTLTVHHQKELKRIVITVGDPFLASQYPHLAEKIETTGKVINVTFKVKAGVDADAVAEIFFEKGASYNKLNGDPGIINTKPMNVNVIASNHECTAFNISEATCTEGKYCTHCGKVDTAALGHKEGAAATCTTNQICERCKIELVSAKGHTPGAAATCTTAQNCETCKTELAPAKGHTPGAAATCTTNQTCDVCKAELASAKGHTPGAAATCTTNQTCDVCKAELAPAKGHTPGAAATCTTNQICDVCKVELAPAKGHAAQNLPSKAATCTETGLTQGSKCETCGEVLKAQETVAALGHNWSTSWNNSSSSGHYKACKTCGEKKDNAAHTMVDGVCSVCGYGCKHTGGTATCSEQAVCTSCNKPYGELLAHTPSAAATCAKAQTCTVCNAVIAEKLDHDLEFVNAKEATCGAIGWDKYEKCKNCDHTTYKEIAATGNHTYGEWTVVTKATTKTPGKQSHTCTACNFIETQEIPVLDGPAIPWLWIVILVVLVCAVVVVIIVIKKKKN